MQRILDQVDDFNKLAYKQRLMWGIMTKVMNKYVVLSVSERYIYNIIKSNVAWQSSIF